jgi:hypothetical protein
MLQQQSSLHKIQVPYLLVHIFILWDHYLNVREKIIAMT